MASIHETMETMTQIIQKQTEIIELQNKRNETQQKIITITNTGFIIMTTLALASATLGFIVLNTI